MAYKKHYRKPGGRSSDIKPQAVQAGRPAGKKGLLSFFFSVKGAISKELFIGASLVLGLASLVLSVASNVGLSKGITGDVLSVLQIIVLASLIAVGYKRAHALGISGFYSIVGTSLFVPFFMFWRPAGEGANDGAYKSRFEFLRKIGGFFAKNNLRGALYLVLVYATCIAASMLASGNSTDMAGFLITMFVFNMLQMLILKRSWPRKYYASAVKVISFLAYSALIAGVAFVVAYMQIMIQIMQASGRGG